MKKSITDSRIEIWSDSYINEDNDVEREPEDKNVIIIQIEECQSSPGTFIVEVVNKPKLSKESTINWNESEVLGWEL